MIGRVKLLGCIGALILGVSSCGGKEPTTSDPGDNNGSKHIVTATITGTPFTATIVSGAYLNGNLVVSGVNGNKSIHINATGLTGVGTYSVSFGNSLGALAQVIDADVGTFSTGYGGAGTVTLTAASITHVAGHFEFTAYTSAGGGLGKPAVTVQNGEFDITVP